MPHAISARRLVVACSLALVSASVAGCSAASKAAADRQSQSPTPSPTRTSASPTASPAPNAQQAASRAAYAAYVGTQNDVVEVINSTRSDTDPRLSRHAASTGIAELAQTVEGFVTNHFGLRGHFRVVDWRPIRFYPSSGKPTAMLATTCVDSSGVRVYDVRTGKEQQPLPGHQRTPVTVRAQVDHRAWKIVEAKTDYSKTC